MANLTDIFVPKVTNCSEILNAGSALYLAPLVNCATEPIVYTVSSTVAIAVLGTTATLQITAPIAPVSSILLRQGAILTFGAGNIVLAEDTVVTSAATTVANILPATSAIAANATALTWGALKLLSPTAIPIENPSQTVNRTDLSNGLQGSEVKTKVMMTSQIELITQPKDEAFWRYIFKAAQNNDDVYCLIIRGSDQRHAYGRVKVTNLNDAGQIEEINRITFTLNFQAPFAAPTLFSYLTVGEKAAVNNVRSYAGLAPLV